MSGRFRVNTPHVINEVIDGEAVIINLATGDYFSLRGSGAYIWSAVTELADVHQIVDALVSAGMPAPGAEAAVTGLLDELATEGLVVHVDDGLVPERPTNLTPPTGELGPPALEKFTDMQDLILLDPVHEVDERGWPHEPTPS